MTYGEYHYYIKYSIDLIDGKWVGKSPNITVPKKMSKEDAIIYYNGKLRDYWNNSKSKN